MRLTDAAEHMFARHETFHPRYGWFRKAYAQAARDPRAFSRDDAPVEIGVGKNMVKAIRFWGLAAKMIVEDPKSPNPRSPDLVPTCFGHALFGESGWDRYMEDPGTLWLLHWRLLAAPSRLPVWWLAFNEFNAVEFTSDDLEATTAIQLDATAEWANPHPKSLKKDLSAFFRTYAPAERSHRTGIEDHLDCPLRELNLIDRSAATGRYRFTLGPKASLPSAIVSYAVLDYVSRAGTGGKTVTLSRLAREPGAPGLAFKLTETELRAALEPTLERTDALSLTTPTGAAQLAWSQDPATVATTILDDYYGASPTDVLAGPYGDQPIEDDLIDILGLGREPGEAVRRLHAFAGAR